MREKIEIILQDGENELVFVIEQMPATKMQKFMLKAMPLLSGLGKIDLSNKNNGENSQEFSFLQKIDFEKAEPLIDELYTCVKRKVDNALVQVDKNNIDGMISSVTTLLKLQSEVIKHNFAFLSQEGALTFLSTPIAPNSYNMRTSAPK